MPSPIAAAAAAEASFPVVFFDGDREIDIGAVAVHPSMAFKKFQATISHKIGIAPHQISTSLVRRKKARPSPEIRRRVPINESSDFASLARERDCFVLAVLRRSRRGGRAKGGDRRAADAVDVPEKTILKRNPSGVDPGPWDYESQLRDLHAKRCLMAASGEAFLGVPRSPAMAAPPPPPVCRDCLRAREEGTTIGFHWCVYDAVTIGFRSPVGPIMRPPKRQVEAF